MARCIDASPGMAAFEPEELDDKSPHASGVNALARDAVNAKIVGCRCFIETPTIVGLPATFSEFVAQVRRGKSVG